MVESSAHHRSSLPVPDRRYVGPVTYDAKDPETSFPVISPLAAPEGAPNIVLILLDDAGYGATNTFGGVISTPTFDRLARGGRRYTKFHTTALCSPTRAALLSGRNHHSVNMGGITEGATSAPGQTSVRPNSAAPLAETLRLNGYATAQIGKCHEVPVWETSPMGPFDRWPNPGGGFEYFFGFIGGETDQYFPTLFENTTPTEPAGLPNDGYTLNEELADRAIDYLNRHQAVTPAKPFFLYYAPGATHAPHHVPTEWSDKYRGRFDDGWDALREEILGRQLADGSVPQGTELTERSPGLPAWEETDPAMRPVLARQMEIYAGFMEQTDHHIGRIIDSLEEHGILDETLVILIAGDNGASAEGTLQGTLNEMMSLNGFSGLETPELMQESIDKLGTPGTHNHYAAAWAHAMNTPFQWTKQVASHFGGTRNPMIVHWPSNIDGHGEVCEQFGHVIDIAPTVLEVAGIVEPTFVNGVQQTPYEGTSLAYTFAAPDAPERHITQYFEMVGNRGIYHRGWSAVTKHRTPWETGDDIQLPAFDDDVWELYDTSSDWSQSDDLSQAQPGRLAELQRLWLIEATRYGAIPLDDRFAARAVAEIAGRPELITSNSQRLFSGMRLSEAAVVGFKNRSYAITAEITVPGDGADGVIFALGGRVGGVSLYLKDGVPSYCYNFFGRIQTVTRGTQALAAGEHQVRVEFAYDGGGLAKGGTFIMFTDDEAIGTGRVEHTVPGLFSASEPASIGRDSGAPVSDEYPERDNAFTGKIAWVQIDVGDLDPEHHVAERQIHLNVAQGTQ